VHLAFDGIHIAHDHLGELVSGGPQVPRSTSGAISFLMGMK
jgi:hypothetical protein